MGEGDGEVIFRKHIHTVTHIFVCYFKGHVLIGSGNQFANIFVKSNFEIFVGILCKLDEEFCLFPNKIQAYHNFHENI